MKFIHIVLLFLVALSSIYARVHHRHQRPKKASAWLSKTGNFVKGVLTVLLSDLTQLETWKACLTYSDDDEKEAGAKESTAVNPSQLDTQENSNTFFGLLGSAVNFICQVKDTIETFFSKSRRFYLRRQRRLFAQGKISRIRAKWWLWKSIKNIYNKVKGYITSAATKLWSGVSNAVAKFPGLVKEGWEKAKASAAALQEWIQEKLEKVFSVVGNWLMGLKTKIIAMFDSKWFKAYTNFIKCATLGAKLSKGVKGLFMPYINIPANIAKLAISDPTAWVKLIVNMICGWETLKNVFVELTNAWKEKDSTKKWLGYGKSVGYLTFVNKDALKRRRHRRHFY